MLIAFCKRRYLRIMDCFIVKVANFCYELMLHQRLTFPGLRGFQSSDNNEKGWHCPRDIIKLKDQRINLQQLIKGIPFQA